MPRKPETESNKTAKKKAETTAAKQDLESKPKTENDLSDLPEQDSSKPTAGGRKDIGAIIGGGIFGLFVALLISAFQIAGVIDMGLAHTLIFLAWILAVVGIAISEQLLRASRQRKIIVVTLSALILGFILLLIDFWMVNKKAELDKKAEQEKQVAQTQQPLQPVQTPDFPVEKFSFAVESIPSPHEEYPFGLLLTIQSTTKIEPVHFQVICSGKIGKATAGIGFGAYFNTSTHTKDNIHEFRWESPALTPQKPVQVRIFSAQKIQVLKVIRGD